MADLKLGRLPKVGLVRMTISIPEPLKEELDRYAAEHSRLYEPVDAATLIPHMLEAFIRSDRGYRSRRAQSRRGNIVNGRAPQHGRRALQRVPIPTVRPEAGQSVAVAGASRHQRTARHRRLVSQAFGDFEG